jgi:hypothetical protein
MSDAELANPAGEVVTCGFSELFAAKSGLQVYVSQREDLASEGMTLQLEILRVPERRKRSRTSNPELLKRRLELGEQGNDGISCGVAFAFVTTVWVG